MYFTQYGLHMRTVRQYQPALENEQTHQSSENSQTKIPKTLTPRSIVYSWSGTG